MRLTSTQRDAIIQIVSQHFGENVKVWLFGSRVNDTKRGGDIDLYLESAQEHTLLSELRCKIILEETLGLPVDLIINQHNKNKPIYKIAKQQGILL